MAFSSESFVPDIHPYNFVSSKVIPFHHVKIRGDGNVFLGSFVSVVGDHNKVKNTAKIYGNYNQARGELSEVRGNENKVIGDHSTIYGNKNVVAGNECVIIGDHNIVRGHKCKISGNYNVILGKDCTENGKNNTFVSSGVTVCTEAISLFDFQPEPPLSSGGYPPMPRVSLDRITYYAVDFNHPPWEGLDDLDEIIGCMAAKLEISGIDGRKDVASDSATPCSICCANDACMVLIPCGHKTLCIECAKGHRDANKKPTCPICRANIKLYQYVFK